MSLPDDATRTEEYSRLGEDCHFQSAVWPRLPREVPPSVFAPPPPSREGDALRPGFRMARQSRPEGFALEIWKMQDFLRPDVSASSAALENGRFSGVFSPTRGAGFRLTAEAHIDRRFKRCRLIVENIGLETPRTHGIDS